MKSGNIYYLSIIFLILFLSADLLAQRKKYHIEQNPDQEASFVGGSNAYDKFISENLVYPKSALLDKIEGEVVMSVLIERDGRIVGRYFENNIGGGCGAEALRLLSMMPNWIPAKMGKKDVRSYSSFKVNFSLPESYEVDLIPKPQNDEMTDQTHTLPEYPDGNMGFGKFLMQNIRYPDLAMERNVQGRVEVMFIVEKDGSLSNIQIHKGIGSGCDMEALRILTNCPKWQAGTVDGIPTEMWYTMPVNFQLQ